MSSLVINFERIEDIRLLEQLAGRLGLQHFRIPAAEQRLAARKALVNSMVAADAATDVPEELIAETIEKIRSKRHAKKQNQGSR